MGCKNAAEELQLIASFLILSYTIGYCFAEAYYQKINLKKPG